ncbi:MAG: signal peptide peptidase SppA [Tissierellia bacterium]|nr:signal peptide peptidase SppA [Tissierellia bacterium]
MNKKRWLALGLAVLILIVSFAVPKYNPVTEDNAQAISKMLPFQMMGGMGGITESELEPGDKSGRIVHLTLKGTIADTSSNLSGTGYNHDFLLSQLELIKEDPTVKAILFEVDTPGGGAYESAEILDQIKQIQEARQIPVYVTMQSMATSGGYYVSASADKIYASPETWTGSIGVIMQMYNFTGLFEKYGISVNTLKSGANKDIGSSSRPMTEEEKALLQELIDDAYQRFVGVVAEGRDMDEAIVRKLADGRIYTANQALENGLVDGIMYQDKVLERLRADHGLENAQVFQYQLNNPFSLYSSMLSLKSFLVGQKDPARAELEQLLSGESLQAPRLMYLYGGE